MKALTKQEAIEAMKQGKRVTHRHFSQDEWVSSNQNGIKYTLEDGVTCWADEFWKYRTDSSWEADWKIFEEK